MKHAASIALYHAGTTACWLSQHGIPGCARMYLWCMRKSLKLDKCNRVWERVT